MVRNEVRVMGDGYKSGRVVGEGVTREKYRDYRYLTRTEFCIIWMKCSVEVDLAVNDLLL